MRLFAILTCMVFVSVAYAQPAAPPDVAAALKKMSEGKDLTTKEEQAVDAWLAKQNGEPSVAASSPKSGAFTVGSGVDQNPCRAAGHAVAIGTPGRDAFVAMAKDAARAYAAKLPADGRGKLTALLQSAKAPMWGGDFALILIARGSGSAAAVSAATAAQNKPDDAITANNLGVALRGMKDYARASIALGYARQLAPDSPVVQTNLGWLAMSQGDAGAADNFFKAALTRNAEMAAALAGRGLILQCAKKSAQALPLFRASLKAAYSDLAAAGVQSAEAGSPSNIGSPSDYASRVPGEPPTWPEPALPATAAQMAGSMKDPSAPSRVENFFLQRTIAITGERGPAEMKKVSRSTAGNAQHLVFTRGYDKEEFVLSDIRHLVARDMDATLERWGTDYEQFKSADRCMSCPGGPHRDPCAVSRPRVTSLYPQFRGKVLPEWTELRKSTADLYDLSRPWIARIHNPANATVQRSETEMLALEHAMAFASMVNGAGQEVEAAYDEGDCNPPPSPAPPKLQALKKYKVDPEECKSGETHMNFGVANLNADCDHMTLDFGEGAVFSGDYKFGKDWGDDQITIFAGAGVNAGLGPLSAGAKTGAFITLQGGEIVDYGNQSTARVSAGYGPMSAGVEASSRISAVSGLDVSIDKGVTIAPPGAD